MLSEPQMTVLLQKLNEVNEEVGAEYELRRLEAAYCAEFNKNRVCTKPDTMAKKLTRQLVIEDAIQDNVRIEHIITGLQQEAETRAEETAKLDKLIAFWGAYTVDFIKNKTADINTKGPVSAEPTDAVVNVASNATGNAVPLVTDSTVTAVNPTTDSTVAAVSLTTDSSAVAAVHPTTDDDEDGDDASPSVTKHKHAKCRSS